MPIDKRMTCEAIIDDVEYKEEVVELLEHFAHSENEDSACDLLELAQKRLRWNRDWREPMVSDAKKMIESAAGQAADEYNRSGSMTKAVMAAFGELQWISSQIHYGVLEDIKHESGRGHGELDLRTNGDMIAYMTTFSQT